METLGALILLLFGKLKIALGQIQTQDRAYNERLLQVYNRWHRTMRKLETLWQRWTTNTLPKKRPSQAGIPRTRKPKPEGHKPYPSGHRWMQRDWRINGAGALLLNYINKPEFQQFIQAVPQAARLLRPVLKTLHIAPPAFMALPPRPCKPRPKKPRFKRDPMPPKPRGGWVARNAVLDIAGYPKFVLKPRLDTS